MEKSLINISEITEDTDYLERIKYLLKVMNPISLESLSFHLKVKAELLKELISKFINDGQLNAKIINDRVYHSIWETNFFDEK